MASLEYLLTLLPSLPAELGDKVSIEQAYATIRSEDDTRLNYLIDLLSAEDEIINCGYQHFVLKNKEYEAELSSSLPEAFKEIFFSFREKEEADWLTAVYGSWLDMLIETGNKTGSSLLKEWAKWEYSLRITFMFDRLKQAGIEFIESELTPVFMYDSDYDMASLVEAYRKTSEPMKAEKNLDGSRLDFIRNLATRYSFSVDELVAYILELRIYARYTRLSPDVGRKILQEVTAL